MGRIQTNLAAVVLVSTVAVVLLFGTITFFWVRAETRAALAAGLEKQGAYLAQSLAVRAADGVLQNDRLMLGRLVQETQDLDEGIRYAFIVGLGEELIADTFHGTFPTDLLQANPIPPDRPYFVRRIVDSSGSIGPLRDVAAPIAGGYGGFAHVGIDEDAMLNSVRRLEQAVAGMVVAFVAFGVIGAGAFNRAVTRPLQRLEAAVSGFDLDTLEARDADPLASVVKRPGSFGLETEVDRLARSFQSMVGRLSEAYQRLRSTQQQLIHAERLSTIGVIAAGLAHELNNPLTGMSNCLRRIRRHPNDREQFDRYLSAMQESAARMQRVVSGLLDLARRRAPERKKTPVKALFQRVTLLAGHRLTALGVSPRIAIQPGASIVVADESQLEQVLLNLVLNSCDSLEERKAREPDFEPRLWIEGGSGSGGIQIEVRDNGVGVERTSVPRVFDPFFSTKDPGKGTGLGLSIASQIVQAHGGEISLESAPGEGASFRMSIPFVMDSARTKRTDSRDSSLTG